MRVLQTVAAALLLALPAAPAAADVERIDYMLNCQGCHLPGGEGAPARGVPRLTGEMGKFLSVEGGRAFLVQVPGSAQSDLSDARLAAVLNWMLRKFSPDEIPADFQPYAAAEVGELRQAPLLQIEPVREALQQEIRAKETPLAKEAPHHAR